MKYLFLIIVCYTVKCDNVGNNYFVVEMAEDNLQHPDIKDLKKPFQVYWNVPTMQCASKKILFQDLYEKYGIIQNDNDRFIGDKIVIIYKEIDFPAIIYNKTSGKNIIRNGGVPQEGDLEKHLVAFENELKNKIPDPYFDGIGIIDFESWRPVFRQNFGSLVHHRDLSIDIEKKNHNWWPKMWIEREASLRFEAGARRFMQNTLSMVKELRPNALWGYYGFPYCFNMRGRDMTEKCAKDTNTENDSIYWLWAESTALFPSLYSSVSLTSSQLSSLIKGRVKETSRVRGKDTPFFPYFWFKYRDDAEYITEKDLQVALNTLYQSNASGFIIWGSSNDVNTVEKCNNLYHYVETVLGPNIAKYTKRIKKIHSDSLQNFDIYLKETSTHNLINSQSTHFINNIMSATEIPTEYNTYTNTDGSSQTLNNDDVFSTESQIIYNEDINSDNSQTLDNNNLSLSSSERSIIHSEYVNTNQSKQILNITKESPKETSNNIHIKIENNSKILKNEDILLSSSQTSTDYNVYTNFEKKIQTLNNNEMSLSKDSISTSNFDHSYEEPTIVYDEDFESGENVDPLNIYELKSSYKDSTTASYNVDTSFRDTLFIYNEDMNNQSIHTLNIQEMSSTETSVTDNEHSNIKETTKILNNVDLFSSPSTEKSPQALNNDISLEKFSTPQTSIIYSDYVNASQNKNTFNTKEVSSKEKPMIYDTFVSDRTTESLKETSTDSNEVTYTDERTDILIDSEIITENNKFQSTGNYFINHILFNSTKNVSNYLIKVDNSVDIKTNNQSEYSESTDVANDYLIIVKNLNNKTNLYKNITDNKLEETQTDNNIRTVTKRDTTNNLDLIVTYIDKKYENNEDQISTKDESFHDTNIADSNEDKSDYLKIIDNSLNIDTNNQSKHIDITNDNEYLIKTEDLNKKNENGDIFDNKLENVYSETKIVTNLVTEGNFEDFYEGEEDADLVAYINKGVGNMDLDDNIRTRDEAVNNINILNPVEDISDYLIRIDYSTNNKTTEQYQNTEGTIADQDYLIINRNLNNKQNDRKNPFTSQMESDNAKDTENYNYSTTEIFYENVV